MQAEWRTLRANESPLLEIRKSLQGKVEVLSAEHRGARAELTELTLQSDGAHGHVNTLAAKHDAAFALEVTVIGNLQATKVARNALSRDVTTAGRRVHRMENALLNLCTEFDGFLGVFNLRCSTICLRLTVTSALLCPLCMNHVLRTVWPFVVITTPMLMAPLVRYTESFSAFVLVSMLCA